MGRRHVAAWSGNMCARALRRSSEGAAGCLMGRQQSLGGGGAQLRLVTASQGKERGSFGNRFSQGFVELGFFTQHRPRRNVRRAFSLVIALPNQSSAST